ncbi:MAG: hypothetical protein K9M80_06155, partial [Candidatus Marinimicrobia bacterium]|nr:hypothetical protein [Candidatus Neomarinimicrobiota bacterium]
MKYIQSDEIANIIKNNYYQSKLLAQYPKLLHGFGSRENGIPPTQDKSDMLETFHQKIANKFKISLNNI